MILGFWGPGTEVFRFQSFRVFGFWDFRILALQMSLDARIPGLWDPGSRYSMYLRILGTPGLGEFKGLQYSGISEFRDSGICEFRYSWNARDSRISGIYDSGISHDFCEEL